MKKTISIHIKGINFLIEEDAYEILKKYMARLAEKLSQTKGKEEIIEDIELRIVELFTAKLGSRKEVIEEKEVHETIATLGEPEQFIEEDTEGTEKKEQKKDTFNQENTTYESSEKRLYRDMEHASIAGVCSGLALYLHMDLIIVRILFILVSLAAGFGVPLYIILWIVLPTANSHIDRLRMQGRPITVENVRDEVEQATARMSKSSQKFASKIHRDNGIQNAFRSLGNLISRSIGGFLLFLGIVFCIAFFVVSVGHMGTTPVKTDEGFMGLYQFGMLFFEDAEQLNFLWLSAGIISVTIIIWLIASGTRLLFNLRYPWYRYLSRSMFFIGIIGVILAFYFGSVVAREFSIEKSIEMERVSSKTPFEIETLEEDYSINNYRHNGYNERHGRNYWLLVKNNKIEENGVQIYYEESPDSLYHLLEEKIATSRNDRDALRRAKNIQFKIIQNGSRYTIPNEFHFPLSDKIRHQRVHVYVQIPKGKSIKVNNEIRFPDSYEDDWESDTLEIN